jgi:hypothetical protein
MIFTNVDRPIGKWLLCLVTLLLAADIKTLSVFSCASWQARLFILGIFLTEWLRVSSFISRRCVREFIQKIEKSGIDLVGTVLVLDTSMNSYVRARLGVCLRVLVKTLLLCASWMFCSQIRVKLWKWPVCTAESRDIWLVATLWQCTRGISCSLKEQE